MLTYDILRSIGGLSLCYDEWEELVRSGSFVTPFQAPEWVMTWWKYFNQGKSPYIFTVREGNDLIGMMPMYETNFPLRSLKSMGRGYSDYLHPLVRSGYERSFSALLSEHLCGLRDVDLVDLQHIRETHSLLELMSDAKVIDQDGCYVLDLPSNFEEYVGSLSKSLRYDVRSKARMLAKSEDAVIHTVSDPSEVDQGLEALFVLHSRRWRKRGLPGSFATKRVRSFHKEYARLALSKGRLRLSTLTFGGEPIGAIYAMCVGKRYFFYQSGFDPDQKSLSPGTVLISHTIKCAIEEGAEEFDFMRGAEAYKARWKPQRLHKNVRLLRSYTPVRGLLGEFLSVSVTRAKNRINAQLVKH